MVRLLPKALAAFILCCAALPAASAVDVEQLIKPRWTQVESENFVVVTDVGPRQARRMTAELEGFRQFMFSRFGDLISVPDDKVPFVLVEDAATFNALGIPSGYRGVLAHSSSGESWVFADAYRFTRASHGKISEGRSAALHELVHYFIRHSAFNKDTPAWFDEGAADYLSTYVEHKDQVLLGDAETVLQRIYALLKLDPETDLLREEVISSEQLFNTPAEELHVVAGSTPARENEIRGFYGRSLAVVHYLSANYTRTQQLMRYLELVAAGSEVNDAFASAFDTSYAEFDQSVAAHFQQQELPVRKLAQYGSSRDAVGSSMETERLSRKEALEFLVGKIAALPDTVLGEGSREAMLAEVEARYPGLVADVGDFSKPATSQSG